MMIKKHLISLSLLELDNLVKQANKLLIREKEDIPKFLQMFQTTEENLSRVYLAGHTCNNGHKLTHAFRLECLYYSLFSSNREQEEKIKYTVSELISDCYEYYKP
jgi:hypothetical protein